MSSVSIAAGAMQALHRAGALLAENDAQFDPTKVTPGVMGFVVTGVFAVAVIVLGFLLVSRLRRNAYRHEIREDIAQELAERERTDGAAPGPMNPGVDPDLGGDLPETPDRA